MHASCLHYVIHIRDTSIIAYRAAQLSSCTMHLLASLDTKMKQSSAILAQKGKSFYIFRYSPKPMPAMVTNIKNEWVLVQFGCPQIYS